MDLKLLFCIGYPRNRFLSFFNFLFVQVKKPITLKSLSKMLSMWPLTSNPSSSIGSIIKIYPIGSAGIFFIRILKLPIYPRPSIKFAPFSSDTSHDSSGSNIQRMILSCQRNIMKPRKRWQRLMIFQKTNAFPKMRRSFFCSLDYRLL